MLKLKSNSLKLTKEIESELGSNPLIAALPQGAVQKDFVLLPEAVRLRRGDSGHRRRQRRRRRRRDVSNDVVDEPEVFCRQLQRSLQVRVENFDPVAFDVDDDVGDAALLLEQNVRRADEVSRDAGLRQRVDVGQGQVGVAKVSAGEDLQRQAEVFVGRVGDAGRVGNVDFDAFFESLFSFMLIRVAIDFVPGDVVQGSR